MGPFKRNAKIDGMGPFKRNTKIDAMGPFKLETLNTNVVQLILKAYLWSEQSYKYDKAVNE